MNKRLLFYFLLIISVRLFPQAAYTPFPDSSATWVEEHSWGGGYPCIQVHTYEVYIEKDTIVNNLVCKKLAFNHHHSTLAYPGCWNIYNNYTSGLYGCLRNDTVNKRIYLHNRYLISNVSADDSLLYDFSKGVGDTVYSALGRYVIDSLGTATVGIASRKKFCVHFPDAVGQGATTTIIEGVGTEKGLFYDPYNWEGGDFLLCFSQNSQKLYPDTAGQCQQINSVMAVPEKYIRIFPNPAAAIVNIEAEGEWTSLTVRSVLGEIAICQESHNETVNVAGLAPGVYWLQLENNAAEVVRKKLVVARE
jgi:hypothetical protein